MRAWPWMSCIEDPIDLIIHAMEMNSLQKQTIFMIFVSWFMVQNDCSSLLEHLANQASLQLPPTLVKYLFVNIVVVRWQKFWTSWVWTLPGRRTHATFQEVKGRGCPLPSSWSTILLSCSLMSQPGLERIKWLSIDASNVRAPSNSQFIPVHSFSYYMLKYKHIQFIIQLIDDHALIPRINSFNNSPMHVAVAWTASLATNAWLSWSPCRRGAGTSSAPFISPVLASSRCLTSWVQLINTQLIHYD